MRMYNQKNALVVKAVSKDPDKPVLNGVYLDNKKSVGCDGYTLIEVSTVEQEKNNLPNTDSRYLEKHRPVTVNATEFANVMKILKQAKHKLPFLNCAGITKDKDCLEMVTFNSSIRPVISSVGLICDGSKYPNINSTKPKKKPKAKVTLSADKLLKIMQAVKDFKKEDSKRYGGNDMFELSVYDEGMPIKIESHSGETGQDLQALLMPIRRTK